MFKRLSAIFIALIMCFSLVSPVWADDEPTEAIEATASITVQNVDTDGQESTVVAYQIIEPTYDTAGNFVGWQWTKAAQAALGIKDEDKEYISQITTSEFNTLVQTLRSSSVGYLTLPLEGVTAASGNLSVGDYTTNDATAGSYIVLITPKKSAEKIYNPLLVSVNIEPEEGEDGTVANVLINGTVNADGDFVANEKTGVIGDGEGTIVYAKSSIINIDKTTEDEDGNEVNNGSSGDQVPYVVTTTVPTYSKEAYTSTNVDVQFTITDTLSDGLKYVLSEENAPDVTIQYLDVDGETYKDVVNIENSAYSITYSESTPQTFNIAFTSNWILTNPGVKLRISYAAEITDEAVTGFDPNTNTVTLKYTNDPSGSADEITVKYREYTFSINGTITQNTKLIENNTQINFVKTGENEEYIGSSIKTDYGPVKGAAFALYDNKELVGEPIRTATTDENGLFEMKQLGVGTYWLVETQPPAGYALNSIPIKVVITATITDDILTSYTVAIGNDDQVKSSTYNATYNSEQELSTVSVADGSEFYELINSTISTLPSTGSFGTYAFILIGCVIMATALTIFVVKRKERR